MARIFRDLKVNEKDGKIRLNLYNRDGSVALRDVTAEVSSEIVQQGDRWSAAAANCLLRIGEDGQPQVALRPEDIGAAAEQDGVNLYTHKKAGKQHTLTGAGDNIRFVAAADFAAGDTFLVNGVVCTAKTAAGDPLWSGYFKTGAVVVCWRSGNSLTFNGGGLPAPQAAKLTPENIKSGVSVDINGKTVAGTFTQDANIVSEAIQKGFFGYANGKRVDGSLVYLGSEPLGTGGAMYQNNLFIYFGDQSSAYILNRGVKLPQEKVAQIIGLASSKIMQGNTILGMNGTAVPMNAGGIAYLGLGATKNEANQFVPFGSAGYGSALFESVDASHVRCKKSGMYEIVVIHRRTTEYNLTGTLAALVEGGRTLGSFTSRSSNWENASTGNVMINAGETIILRTIGENAWYEKCAISIVWKE